MVAQRSQVPEGSSRPAQFVTIGHSNRCLNDFTDMLRSAEVGMVIDVRAFPRSRSNTAYNIDVVPEALGVLQIGYRHIQALGGRRPRQSGVPDEVNALWRVQSFHNYADYALGTEFAAAIGELVRTSCSCRLALMCSEAVWWRCHRRIICDHLLLGGHAVDHIMGPGYIRPATPTPGVQIDAHGRVVYPKPSDSHR